MQVLDITLERCSVEDYAMIAEIYNEHIRLGVSSMEETLKTEADIAGWVKKFHDREGLYVCRKEGKVIGWGIIKRYSDREGYRFACETAIYLTSSETGKGYGGQMKLFLIEECKRMNYRHLVAKIFATNIPSINYNKKLGYEIVGFQKEIGFKNGKWVDIAIMQYIIT